MLVCKSNVYMSSDFQQLYLLKCLVKATCLASTVYEAAF